MGRLSRLLAVAALLLAALCAASVSSSASGLPKSLKPFAKAVRATQAGKEARKLLSTAPQFDAALASLVLAIAQADKMLAAAAAAAPSAAVITGAVNQVVGALSAATAAAGSAWAAAGSAWTAALQMPALAAAADAAQQAVSAALAAAAPVLAAVSPVAAPIMAQWQTLLKAAAALPPAQSLAAVLIALYVTRGRSGGSRKAPAPRLPLVHFSFAASRARSSYSELAALAEALRFALVASAPVGAVVPPAQRKEAAAALEAIAHDTEALLVALKRAQGEFPVFAIAASLRVLTRARYPLCLSQRRRWPEASPCPSCPPEPQAGRPSKSTEAANSTNAVIHSLMARAVSSVISLAQLVFAHGRLQRVHRRRRQQRALRRLVPFSTRILVHRHNNPGARLLLRCKDGRKLPRAAGRREETVGFSSSARG
jgi:hypothetical protein